jgi:hypothetical protein
MITSCKIIWANKNIDVPSLSRASKVESPVATRTAHVDTSHLQTSPINANTPTAFGSQTKDQPSKVYTRLTEEQTRSLERLFKKDPYPKTDMKKEYSRDLGLELHTVSVGSQRPTLYIC